MARASPMCPKCGSSDVEVARTWQLVSPIPDRRGRITVTVMGVLSCKSCKHSWKSVVSKIKVGDSGVEVDSREVSRGEGRRVKEIVLDLSDLSTED